MGTKCGDLISVVLVGLLVCFFSHQLYQSLTQFRVQYVRPPEVPFSRSDILFSRWQQKRANSQRCSAPYARIFALPSTIIFLTRKIPIAPSMFGRDLIEQVRADAKGEERYVPVIVEKCIDAVDALGEFTILLYAS